MINGYQELVVWQRSIELVLKIYKVTKIYPKEETYSLVSQTRRSSVSIPSNIAEGRCRGTKKDFVQFLRIALGSTAELHTQIIISFRLEYLDKSDFDTISSEIEEISKMLNAMINKLTANS